MPLLEAAPSKIQETAVYHKLQQTVSHNDGLIEKVELLVATTTPLLDFVLAGPFQHYTLHNPAHARRLVHLAGTILSQETLSRLSALECSLIIFASYLHDLGMCVMPSERENIIKSDSFKDHLANSRLVSSRIQNTRRRQAELTTLSPEDDRLELDCEIHQLYEVALASYLRPRHAEPSTYRLIFDKLKKETRRPDLFEFRGVPFEDLLVDICASHNLDVGVLSESSGPYNARFPRDKVFAGQKVNAQLCASLLRVSDILDFDRERTPAILFENIGIRHSSLPGAEVSLKEWQKHMAVHTVEFAEHEIVISASSTHPAIEASIRFFAVDIEREIRDVLFVLRNNPAHISDNYKFSLPPTVRVNVSPVGYTYHDIRLRPNESSVINLLMGERLYTNSAAAARELVQNAVDACDVRRCLSGGTPYDPLVSMVLARREGSVWLDVSDNGIGMDEHVISQYLFQVGSSYYGSSDFERLSRERGVDFVPTARFGIGILSAFMIGDVLEVTTSNAMSMRGDHKERTVRIESRGGLAFVTERTRGPQGTTVRVRLKPDFAHDHYVRQMAAFLSDVVVRPKCKTIISLEAIKFERGANEFMSIRSSAAEYASSRNVELVVVSVDDAGEEGCRGVIVIPFNVKDGMLDLAERPLTFDRLTGLDPMKIFSGFSGNRLTVNGFRMGLKNANRIFGRRIRCAFDIDVSGDKNVVFDVSRDRVIGNGLLVVRQRLRAAIAKALSEAEVAGRLTPRANEYILSNRLLWGDDAEDVDSELLDAVAKLVPDGTWPIGIHRTIAESLGISGTRARVALSMLLETGRIPDGRRAKES